jgi:hypothetical protein
MYKLKMIARKFWCLMGFVAIIFTILAARCVYVAFLFPSFWNILSAALMGIFAYWWLSRILSKPGGCSRGSTNYHGSRDLDL